MLYFWILLQKLKELSHFVEANSSNGGEQDFICVWCRKECKQTHPQNLHNQHLSGETVSYFFDTISDLIVDSPHYFLLWAENSLR